MAEATEAAAANARPGPRGRESGPAGAAKLASAKKAARRVRAKAAAEAAAEVEAAEAAAQQIAADNVEGAVERAAGPATSLPTRAGEETKNIEPAMHPKKAAMSLLQKVAAVAAHLEGKKVPEIAKLAEVRIGQDIVRSFLNRLKKKEESEVRVMLGGWRAQLEAADVEAAKVRPAAQFACNQLV